MITPERIKNMAYEYCEGADELEYRDLIDFAGKLLAEAESVITDLVSRNDALIENERKLLEVLNELRNRRGKSAYTNTLAEVKLQDLLEKEEEFIEENKKSFMVEFSYKDECFSHVRFGSYFITLHTSTGLFYEINWIDYLKWKQQLGLDELTEQAQDMGLYEVKK